MLIFKHKSVGGAVPAHQDGTFLYTDPPSAVGLWFALEDCTPDNGCLVRRRCRHGPALPRRRPASLTLRPLSACPSPTTSPVLPARLARPPRPLALRPLALGRHRLRDDPRARGGQGCGRRRGLGRRGVRLRAVQGRRARPHRQRRPQERAQRERQVALRLHVPRHRGPGRRRLRVRLPASRVSRRRCADLAALPAGARSEKNWLQPTEEMPFTKLFP